MRDSTIWKRFSLVIPAIRSVTFSQVAWFGTSARTRAPMVVLFALVFVSASCDDRSELAPVMPTVDASYMTASVRNSIGADGRLVLDHASLSPKYPEIDELRATRLAAALVGNFASWVLDQLSYDRHAPIHLAQLHPCGRAYYAHSAYDAPGDGTSQVTRKAAGPRWLVPFCNGGVQEILAGVSAYATDVVLDSHGRISNAGSANFSLQGVPVGLEIPIPPERVVASIAQTTGQKIAAVPELIMRERPYGPALALWHVRTEAGVSVTDVHGRRTVSDLFVGYYMHWTQEVAVSDTLPGAVRSRSIGEEGTQFSLRAIVPAKLTRVVMGDQ